MKSTLVLFVIGLLSWNAAFAAQPNAAGIVSVSTAADGARSRVGFVADDKGHVIARINAPDQILFVNVASGASYTAHTIAYDTVNKLSLLKVANGSGRLQPYTFARDPAELQRQVFGIKVHRDPAQSQAVRGTLASVKQLRSSTRPDYYLHNALVGGAGMGGPLFNNCAEVVGVIVPQPQFLKRLFIREKESTAYAVPIEWLVRQFGTQGMQPASAATTCLSQAAQTATAQAELEEKARQAAQAARAKEAAQAELDSIRGQLEEAQGANEEERRRLEAEIEARQTAVDEAQAQEEATQEALEEAQRTAQQQEQQYMLWGILGASVLLMLLFLVWVLKQRTVTRERREKAAAKSRAEEAQASLATREEEEERIRQTPTVFFEGTDSAGQAVALRIPGVSIAASEGVIVGRNPEESDFVIRNPQVSRKHFRLFADKDLLMIEDFGSTNGTKVDGKSLGAGEKTVLGDLSRVELSDLKLSVQFEQG